MSSIFNPLKNLSGTLVLAGVVFLSSCQEGSNKGASEKSVSADSVYTGLDGTRDQSAQVGGADVKIDTSAGQTGGTGGLPGNADSASGVRGSNESFLYNEVAGNYAEIKMAKLALKNSSNVDIKSIARIIEKDHTSALGQLKSMATRKKLNIPSDETPEYKGKFDEISNKTGNDFDKAWCSMLMEKHKNTINKYEEMAKATSDGDLKNWINNVLPKLRIHHDKLMACNSKIKT